MHQHPAVALAAAIGRPDAHAGEVPVVYVQLRPSATATPQDLLEWAQSQIAERAAWPKQIRILDALPTTAVGRRWGVIAKLGKSHAAAIAAP
jgi:fatty-acyl-CoA synthase